MCISIQQDALTAELYVSVRDAVGFYHYDREDARMSLDGGLYSVVAYVDGQVAGIGRVVGDGRIAFFINRSTKSMGSCAGRHRGMAAD